MAGYLARFVKGGRIFDVSSSPYKVATDFVPPSTNTMPLTTAGTSSNRYGGEQKVSERATNITFNLPILITGSSEPEVRRSRRDLAAFLALGSDKSNPMYFEFRPDVGIDDEPLYGQFGANSRIEIVHGYAPAIWNNYGVGTLRARGERLDIPLMCKPFIVGKQQILGLAKGGIREDRVGVVDGIPKGLSIPAGTTNLFSNPIFENSTSSEQAWTYGADLDHSENTDQRFVLFGKSSSKVTAIGATTPTLTESLSLSAVAYSVSCYAKLPSAAAVTSSHIALILDGSSQTTTYTSMGNGWYRLTFTGGSAGGTQTAGVTISQDVTIYVDGFQIEQSAIATEPTFGTLVGVASSGTIFESDVTRTAGVLTFPVSNVLSLDEFTIRIVWDVRDTAAVNRWLFADNNGLIEGRLDNTGQYEFGDGTTTISSSADEPTDYDKIVLHFVAGGGEGLKIYKDGSQIATNASYTIPSTVPTTLYLGTDESGANHANGVFIEFSTYDVAMTAAQALADYNVISPLLDDEKRISAIPFLWTKDGDGVVDNCDDASRDNWAVAGGIPGTHPAITRIDGKVSPGWTGYALWLSNLITDEIIRPGDVVYGEQQGTVDATSSGGEYSQKSVTTSAQTWTTSLSEYDLDALLNKDVYLFTRLYDAGSNLTIALTLTANGTIVTDYRAVTTTTAFQLYKTDPIPISDLSARIPGAEPGYRSTAAFGLSAKRTTGTANARVDYNILMPEPLLRIYPGATAAGSPEGFSYTSHDSRALSIDTNDVSLGLLQTRGHEIELFPSLYNGLISIIGDIAGTTTITHTLTYDRILVTPRWSVL